jgi:hypothetical protein
MLTMTNNQEMIYKKDLCKIVTPTFVEDVISAVDYAEDNGWHEKEEADKLKVDIKKIGNFCGIIRHK